MNFPSSLLEKHLATPTMVVITGPSGAGKTTLGRQLAACYQWPLLSRDDLKERLFDVLGCKDREWSRQLGAASYELLADISCLLMQTRACFILESNFRKDSPIEARLMESVRRHDYQVLQLVLTGTPEFLLKRWEQRLSSGDRHPGHVDQENRQAVIHSFKHCEDAILALPGPKVQLWADAGELLQNAKDAVANLSPK